MNFKTIDKWGQHIAEIEYELIQKSKFREAYNYLWVRLISGEEGLGLTRRLYYVHPALAPYPKRIELEVTTKCFLKCPKCEQTYWHEKQENMSFDNFKKIIDMFPDLCEVSLTGIGHGFENPEYMKMLEYLKSKEIVTQFFDPFLLINEDRQKQLINMGANWIWVSFDGATKETYEACQVGSNYNRVIQNIISFIRLKKEAGTKLPELHFQYIITTTNVHELLKMVDLVHTLIGDTQTLTTIQFIKLIPFKENRHLDPVVSQGLKDQVYARAHRCGNIDINFVHVKSRPPLNQCVAWTVPFICVDGNVYPCCTLTEGNVRHLIQSNTMGNVFENDFHEIWSSEKYNDLRNKLHDGKCPVICNEFKPCMLFNSECEAK
jgi:MoaA/NifB/PqqE/SkfB family radical SAM enzyme